MTFEQGRLYRRHVQRRARSKAEEDARYQRSLDGEHERSSAISERTGRPCDLRDFPAIHELLLAVEAAAARRRQMGRSFSYRGRKFPLQFTSLGRVIALHPTTCRSIGSTDFGSRW